MVKPSSLIGIHLWDKRGFIKLLVAGLYMIKADLRKMSETMAQTPEWWTLPSMLLVHGLNIGGSTKGDYQKTDHALPRRGDVAGSIMSPATHFAYAGEGVILKPIVPTRFSYTNVGSFYPAGSDPAVETRATKGTVWTPEQMTMRELMFLSLACGGYNEVLFQAEDTEIIGVYGFCETVDEYVLRIQEALRKDYTDAPEYAKRAQIVKNALLTANFYVHKKQKPNDLEASWAMNDKLKPTWHPRHEYFFYFAHAVAAGEEDVEALLERVDKTEIFGGEFERQPITKEHRALLHVV